MRSLTFADTKEKPFICFCGAAFARRDLLKRHTRISHENEVIPSNNEAVAKSAASSQPSPASIGYDASTRPVGSMPASAAMQWPVPHSESVPPYLAPIHPPGMMISAGTSTANSADAQPGVHDPAMLQAAQLLVPTGYHPPPRMYLPTVYIWRRS